MPDWTVPVLALLIAFWFGVVVIALCRSAAWQSPDVDEEGYR